MTTLPLDTLRNEFGPRLQENVQLAHYTTARVGGKAGALVVIQSSSEFASAAAFLWSHMLEFTILGGGTNILISDEGLPGVVLLNRARGIRIDTHSSVPVAWAEAGAGLAALAHQSALRGLSGLEWAAAIPGTVGGAVYGNAGAFGGDTATTLLLAEILDPQDGKVSLSAGDLHYEYRRSCLKREQSQAIVLSAAFKLETSTREAIQEKMVANSEKRHSSQPPGASLGSMFKNPPGDYAGRLIEAAGLKGKRIGGAEISSQHANFVINDDSARAKDIYQLVVLARDTVRQQFGVNLELEIELLGTFGQEI